MKKYGVDSFGNTYIDTAQFAEAQGEYVLNPNCESFTPFPEIPEGQRPVLSGTSWTLSPIDPENKFDSSIGYIRPKNKTERYISGLDALPAGQKISGDEL